MKKGALANLITGLTIALLPLFLKLARLDIGRASKDNLLVVLFLLIGAILPSASRKISLSVLLFLAYALFSLVLNQCDAVSIEVVMQMIYISSGIFFFVNFYQKHDSETLHYIVNGMVIGCIIQSVLAISGYFGHSIYTWAISSLFSGVTTVNMGDSGKVATVGSLGNSNLLASYVAITAMAFLNHRWKYLIIIPIFALILSGSFMGMGSFIAGIVYHSGLIGKVKIYTLAILGMFTLPFTSIGMDSGRYQVWKSIVTQADWHHIIVGNGPGWFYEAKFIAERSGQWMQQEHNAFLSLLNTFGLVGFLLLIPSFIRFVVKKDNSIFATVLFASFCNSYGHFTTHQSTVVIIMIVAVAACMAEGKNNVINMEWPSASV